MTTGLFHDQNLEKQIEKQMGCMTGFRQLFDRHHILTGKRLYNTRRLPHYPASECSSQSERSVKSSPMYSRELRTPRHHLHQQEQEQPKQNHRTSCSPTPELHSPAPGYLQSPERTPMHLPVFEFKEGLRSSWKFKEAPRLSLDSRATVDGKGKMYPKENRTIAANRSKNEKQRSSPSVIAKLMGLEALPESGREPVQKAELRRSASESRVSRDLRFMDGNNYQTSSGYVRDNAVSEVQVQRSKGRTSPDLNRKPESQKMNNGGLVVPSLKSHQQQQQRKSYFDAQYVFPEPKQTGSLYGEIEKRLKLRGIDEPAKDLETLKQILEALQLKGLLHSNTREAEQIRNGSRSNIIFDRKLEESPIVVIKPSRSVPVRGGAVPDSPLNLRSKQFGVHKNYNIVNEPEQSIRPRREQTEIDRKIPNQRRNHPNDNFDKSPRRRQNNNNNNIENQNQGRRRNDSMKQRKSNTGYSPKNQLTTNKSPRKRRSVVETCRISPNEDESSTISESSRSTSSQVDTETRVENYKEGRSLLARCDKLLNSIAEITAASGNELQPSPVSVLDSSSLYYKDESSPSPVMKRSIDFKDRLGELEEDNWSPVISPVRLKFNEKSDDCDFLYVSEILRASNSLSEDTDIFLLLEKHQYKSSNSSDPYSKLHRKLVFDTVTELLQKKKQLPPWKAISAVTITGKPSLQQIWSEFLRIKEREPVEDLFEVICGVLRKDIAGDAVNEWDECQMETSEAVLDIERMIFKDLIGETIRDLASFAGNSRVSRRKLVF